MALAVAALLCACQPKPVEGTVVDKYTYPDGGQAVCVDGPGDRPVCSTPVQPTGYYVSIRSDADPGGPTNQIEVEEDLWRDLEVGDRFDELEMVGP